MSRPRIKAAAIGCAVGRAAINTTKYKRPLKVAPLRRWPAGDKHDQINVLADRCRLRSGPAGDKHDKNIILLCCCCCCWSSDFNARCAVNKNIEICWVRKAWVSMFKPLMLNRYPATFSPQPQGLRPKPLNLKSIAHPPEVIALSVL